MTSGDTERPDSLVVNWIGYLKPIKLLLGTIMASVFAVILVIKVVLVLTFSSSD